MYLPPAELPAEYSKLDFLVQSQVSYQLDEQELQTTRYIYVLLDGDIAGS